jgi:hypothetical protein
MICPLVTDAPAVQKISGRRRVPDIRGLWPRTLWKYMLPTIRQLSRRLQRCLRKIKEVGEKYKAGKEILEIEDIARWVFHNMYCNPLVNVRNHSVYLRGIMGIDASFHSQRPNNMAKTPPMVIIEITRGEFHLYVEPPPEIGI